MRGVVNVIVDRMLPFSDRPENLFITAMLKSPLTCRAHLNPWVSYLSKSFGIGIVPFASSEVSERYLQLANNQSPA